MGVTVGCVTILVLSTGCVHPSSWTLPRRNKLVALIQIHVKFVVTSVIVSCHFLFIEHAGTPGAIVLNWSSQVREQVAV